MRVEWHTVRYETDIYPVLQTIKARYLGLRTFGAVIGAPLKLSGNYRVIILQQRGNTVKIEGPSQIISKVNTALEQIFRGKNERDVLEALPH